MAAPPRLTMEWDVPDLSALGSVHGQVLSSCDSRVCFDFEVPLPAVPARARPAAIAASRPAALPAPAGPDRDELTLVAPSSVSAGERFDLVLRFRGTGAVHALSTRLSFRALRDGDPLVRVADARARDAGNRAVTFGAAGSPAATAIRPAQPGAIFPNPFQGALNVSFSLARAARVRLVVYDLAGRAVRKIEDDVRPAGLHVATWDGRGDAGSAAPPGFYIVRFESGEVRQNRQVQLIR